ncbi:hypothetical protein [Kitasatospora sp. NPDC054795]
MSNGISAEELRPYALPAVLAEAVRRGVAAGDGAAGLSTLVGRFRRA